MNGASRSRRARRRWLPAALAAVVAGALGVLAGPAGAQPGAGEGDGAGAAATVPAPRATLADDGLTVSAEGRTLSVSQAHDLDPSGQQLTVSGSGYDEGKGVYVAFCVVPARDEVPTPCGGGAALEGGTGASVWISSNPPPYGGDVSVPYGPRGSFETELTVEAAIGDVDCRTVQCAVVTRNDHTRGADRSQDLFLPVTFRGGDHPSAPEGALPAGATGPVGASGSSGSRAPVAVIPVAVLLLAATTAAVAFVRARRRRGAGS